MSFAIRPEVKDRLEGFRKAGGSINVSRACNAAILTELERCEKPGLADVVARLRVESDRRRGAPYRDGHLEGQDWARSRGSWAEICFYAELTEADVLIENTTWTTEDKTRQWFVPTFKGRFLAPEADYPRESWDASGAPSYKGEDEDGDPVWVDDLNKCDQYWRGWLNGVQEVFSAVGEELARIPVVAPSPVVPPTLVEVLDPDDIPF